MLLTCETTLFMLQWCNTLKIGLFLRKVSFFLLQLRRSKEEEHLRGLGSFTKIGWKLQRSGNELWLVHHCPPSKGHLQPGKGHPLHLRTYYKLNEEGWSFFTFISRDATRKTNILAA